MYFSLYTDITNNPGSRASYSHLYKSFEFLNNVSYQSITGTHQIEWGEDVACKKELRIFSVSGFKYGFKNILGAFVAIC